MALTLRTGGGLLSPASAVNSNKNTRGNNNGGLLGGVGYLAEKSALGFLSSVEGIWDYSAGGVAKLFGVDKWAERQFANDWVDYTHADEWYDPGKGWQIAGDVAGGIGTSMPAIAGAAGAALITYFSGGTAAPAAAKLLSASVAPLIAGFGAAGNATKEAYQKTGNLGAKEFGYGALSGATEAAIEGVTAGIGTGTGRIVSALSKKAAGETVQTLSKSGAKSVIKHLAADFASEAVEEGLAEAIDPLYQKLTIDPNAKAATAQEIGYAALVGGLSGLVMSGGAATVNTIANLSSGNAAINSGNAEKIIKTASSISAYEDANDTGYESYKAISADYKALSDSLKQTGGQITTAKQRMLLGSLKKAETAAFVEPFIERSAENLLLHADSAAERFSAFGMKDADGKEIYVTADEIRSGVDADLIRKADSGKLTEAEQKTFTKQVRAAMRSNSVLTTLATMDATGRITMDSRKFAEAAREGADIATAADINAFAETASQEEIRDLAADLGIADWAALTPDEFREKTAAFAQSDRGRELSYQSRRIRAAMGLAEDSAVELPKAFRGDIAEGATRYRTADGIDMAIIREGDRNYIYNYASGNISRAMSEADVNKILADYWSGNKKAADDARLALSQNNVQNNVQNNAELLGVAATARYNMLAAENNKGWRQLSEPVKQAVRMTMRQAEAAGLSEDTAITFGRVAAHSGMNIVFDSIRSGAGDALQTGNTIYVDPGADKSRIEKRLLIHEMAHALIKRKGGWQLLTDAFFATDPARAKEIEDRYIAHYKKQGLSEAQYMPIVSEEIAVAHLENVLGRDGVWDYMLSDEPSLGEKVLNFFRGSARDYADDAGLSAESRKLLTMYRKMFRELSERNRGNNLIDMAREDAGNKKAVTRMNEENMQGTGERLAFPEGTSHSKSKNVINLSDDNELTHLIKGVTGAKKYKMIQEYILNQLADQPVRLSDGKMAIVDRSDALHIANKSGSIKSARIAQIKKIVETAQLYAEDTKVTHPKFDYFCYYISWVKYDYNTFPIYLNVGKGINDQKYHIYDITKKIGDTANRLNGFERPKPNEGYAQKINVSTNKITQDEKKVNSKSKKSSDERLALPEDSKYLDAVNRGDMDTAQKMVDEAAKKAGYNTKGYHGTPNGGFTVFGGTKTRNGAPAAGSYWFSVTEKHARNGYAHYVEWGKQAENPKVYDVWLFLGRNVDIGNGRVEALDYERDGKGAPSEDLKRVALAITRSKLYYIDEMEYKTKYAQNLLALTKIARDIYADFVWQVTETKEFAELCKSNHIDSVTAYEEGERESDGSRPMVKTYGVFYPSQIKSADPVTYDDNGNVIPLSERFNDDNNDIRYALPEEENPEDVSETRSSVMTKVDPEYKPTVQDKVFSGWTAGQIAFTNAQAGIETIGKKYGVKNIESLVQAARSGRNQAEEMIAGGQWRIGSDSKTYQGEGLEQIMRPISKQGEDVKGEFFDYLFNYHNMSRMTLESRFKMENKPVFATVDENGKETVVTAEQSDAIVKKYEEKYPEFKKTAEKLWAFLRNLNQYRVDTGLISQDTYDYLKKLYPHYVPTYRTGATKGIGAIEGKYNLKVKSTIKSAKGSTKSLLPPDVIIARQVMETVRAGRINQLANALYEGAQKSGDTDHIEIVSKKRVANDEIAELDPTEIRPKNNEVIFFRNGERIVMRVSKEIFAGFDAFNPAVEIHNPLINGAKAINNGFKRVVTSLNPAFLLRNTIRDIQDAGINTKYGKTFVKNYARASHEISHNGKLWQLYRAMGGFSSSVFDFEKGFSGMQNKWGLTKAEGNLMGKTLQSVENANAFVEQLPRLAEFISAIEAGKTPEQAILDSADVTTNFGRTGNITKALNSTLIPFLNPSIQGCSKMIRNLTSIRSAKEFGALAMKAALVGIAPMVLNMLMYDDDEDYKDLRDTDKENNFLFKIGDTFVKIPRGRVASVLGGLVNRGKATIEGEDADWAGYVKNIMQQVTPVDSMSRTIFSPFADVKNNLTWYGSAIEGRQFENVAPRDRYDESTSAIAIAVGKVINYSPKKIHYLLDQYSGVIGDFILPATTAKAEKDFLSGNFTIDPATSNKLSTDFYKMYDKTQYAKTAGDDTAAYQVRYLNKVKSAISDMYKQKSEIQNNRDLSNVEKLQQSRVVQILINEAYKTALQDFDLYTKAIEATAGMEDESLRFTEATRLMYGAERALSEYNSDVYAKCQSLNKAGLDYETLYNYYFTVRDMESDKDSRGNTISGSKRKKVVSAIKAMKLTTDQKLLLICASGYSLQDNDIARLSSEDAKNRLLRYILRIKGATREEKAAIAQMCGFEVNNGKISAKSLIA